jgi:hypothetical protein
VFDLYQSGTVPNRIYQRVSPFIRRPRVRRFLSLFVVLVPPRWKLPFLGIVFQTDKHRHGYLEHYTREFGSLRRKKLTLLEIGVGGYDNPKAGGSSLRMWKAYFPKSAIWAIDFYDKKPVEEKRIKILQGSQNDPAFLRLVAEQIGPIDIIIDDGSHISEHIITAFSTLYPYLASPGIYAIEDLCFSYWPQFGGDPVDHNSPHTSLGLLKGLVDALHHQYIPERQATTFDGSVQSLTFYPKLAFVRKGQNRQRAYPSQAELEAATMSEGGRWW